MYSSGFHTQYIFIHPYCKIKRSSHFDDKHFKNYLHFHIKHFDFTTRLTKTKTHLHMKRNYLQTCRMQECLSSITCSWSQLFLLDKPAKKKKAKFALLSLEFMGERRWHEASVGTSSITRSCVMWAVCDHDAHLSRQSSSVRTCFRWREAMPLWVCWCFHSMASCTVSVWPCCWSNFLAEETKPNEAQNCCSSVPNLRSWSQSWESRELWFYPPHNIIGR